MAESIANIGVTEATKAHGYKEMKLTIKANRRYVTWLARHLQKEHPKTKGKIRLRK
jgi:hypothetical protein